MTFGLSCGMNQGGVRRRLGRLRDALRYTQICCARLAGLFVIGMAKDSSRWYSNEDLFGYYCWKEVVKEAQKGVHYSRQRYSRPVG